jgi:hypothetical protein
LQRQQYFPREFLFLPVIPAPRSSVSFFECFTSKLPVPHQHSLQEHAITSP